QLDDVAGFPFIGGVVDDRPALAFHDVMDDAALAMLLAALAARGDFLHRENQRLMAAALGRRMQIPFHDALGIGFPGEVRAAHDEWALGAERPLPISQRDQLLPDGIRHINSSWALLCRCTTAGSSASSCRAARRGTGRRARCS